MKCSCLHAQDHNGTSTSPSLVALNASTIRHAKNDCFIIFISGSNEEIVSVRFKHIQLRPNCLDYIEIFPYLREPVVENTTLPEYIFCNQTHSNKIVSPQSSKSSSNNKNNNTNNSIIYNKKVSSPFTMSNIGTYANISSATSTTTIMNIDDLPPYEFIYSSGKIFALRLRFAKPLPPKIDNWCLNVSLEYRFLKKDNFKNDGRLIPGTYCDYYFFANPEVPPNSLDIWKYFHSPHFPAKYPSHIKCSYKFIGRPETRVEVIFEELRIPKKGTSCNLDKLTIFDAESANMNAVIDVLCGLLTTTRHILSTGPDLLIEFNASSNITSKGFRGKFKFIQNDIVNSIATDSPIVGEIHTSLKKPNNNILAFNMMENSKLSKGFKEGNCKEIYDSRWNKTGVFESNQLFTSNVRLSNVNNLVPFHNTGRIECIYEFYASGDERVQIKFLDFNIPTEHKNSSECKPNDSLQLLTQVKGKYEPVDFYCGAFLPKPIMSKGPKLMLQFIGKYPTNHQKVGYYGFKAEYKFLTNYGITTGYQLGHNCSFIYNSTTKKTGFFTSPNFPGLYPQNIACHYLFYGEFEEKVKINFSFFDVEGIDSCGYLTASDYVEFSNFISTDRKFPKYCGKRDKFEIRSDDRFFRVSFYTNDRFDRNGFRAYYEFEGKSTPSENTSVQSYTSVLSNGSNYETHFNFIKLLILLIYPFHIIIM